MIFKGKYSYQKPPSLAWLLRDSGSGTLKTGKLSQTLALLQGSSGYQIHFPVQQYIQTILYVDVQVAINQCFMLKHYLHFIISCLSNMFKDFVLLFLLLQHLSPIFVYKFIVLLITTFMVSHSTPMLHLLTIFLSILFQPCPLYLYTEKYQNRFSISSLSIISLNFHLHRHRCMICYCYYINICIYYFRNQDLIYLK